MIADADGLTPTYSDSNSLMPNLPVLALLGAVRGADGQAVWLQSEHKPDGLVGAGTNELVSPIAGFLETALNVADPLHPMYWYYGPAGYDPEITYTVVVNSGLQEPPIITTQPASQTVAQGTNVTFTVAATNVFRPRYQWMFYGTNLPGATNCTLVLTNVTSDQSGVYVVGVSGLTSSTNSEPATLTVLPPPALKLLDFTLHSGEARFRLEGPPGPYRIETSSNLVTWAVLKYVFVPVGESVMLMDTNSLNWPRRFYRAVMVTSEMLPANMALVFDGGFQMGDTFDEGESDERPVHTVYLNVFLMDKFEVTKALWDEVYQWAITNGYNFDNAGLGKAADHPVHTINWYDMVKWCNARSEKEGRLPAYYTSAAQTTVYRSGQLDVLNDWVMWNTGYRLPTEAEWEKAARGGLSGKRFPWGDLITHNNANYYSEASYGYDISATRGYHPTFNDGVHPYTNPVWYFAPNGYGLHDMAGNLTEWCWDWYDAEYYISSDGNNPHGPAGPRAGRVLRGGTWLGSANYVRCAERAGYSPALAGVGNGFRCVMGPSP